MVSGRYIKLLFIINSRVIEQWCYFKGKIRDISVLFIRKPGGILVSILSQILWTHYDRNLLTENLCIWVMLAANYWSMIPITGLHSTGEYFSPKFIFSQGDQNLIKFLCTRGLGKFVKNFKKNFKDSWFLSEFNQIFMRILLFPKSNCFMEMGFREMRNMHQWSTVTESKQWMQRVQ